MTTFQRARLQGTQFSLPAKYYISPEIFAQEQERIFGRQWVCVGRSAQIPGSGDYLLVNLCNESLIVLRNQSGQVRAFYNVCRHRGTRLCHEAKGKFSAAIQCPYHAWTYRLDGQLAAAPHMGEVDNFALNDYPLVSCALAEWEGFLWINLAANPEPFSKVFAPLLNRFDDWNLPSLQLGKQIVYDVQANWKLIFQNYSECYHCSPVHPQLAVLSPSNSGRNDLMHGSFLGGYMTLNPGSSLTMSGTTNRPGIASLSYEDLQRAYYYTFMPNVLFSVHPDYAMVHRLRPISADRTEIVCEWYFEPESLPLGVDDAVEFWDLTNRQDWQVSEWTQLGVGSRAYTPGLYAHPEGLLAAFDQEYLKQIGNP
ncbi:MAG: aromatic ring-hydroxylating dioxygenase subunit alpha [Anaerolineae bacterium]|nr:aromatic ring-hydroxylating dioxygenase subunit alpha [Gloeobacterales cyanobacterium ES-bin-313]